MSRVFPSAAFETRVVGVLVLLPAALPWGCGQQICPEAPPQELQLAPGGRAVAYVDADIFERVLVWMDQERIDPSTSFDCLVELFSGVFVNDVDMLLVVLDLSRSEFLERSRRKVISNFTVPQRLFERGIGTPRNPLGLPVGPSRLRSYSLIGVREGLWAGPSLHEIAHSWCAYLDGPPVLAAQLERPPLNHWGFSSVGGVLGGWASQSFEPLGDDRYRVCGPSSVEGFAPQGYANNNIPYAPLELYLMGLLPPEEVPEIRVAVNPLPQEDGLCPTFTAESIQTVTIEDIMAVHGPREPAVPDARKHFELALVVLAETPLTEIRWQAYRQAMSCLEATEPCDQLTAGVNSEGQQILFVPLSFFEATGGRASLQFVRLEPRADAVLEVATTVARRSAQ